MFRFISACVVATMVATGVVPCGLNGAGMATTNDCCDPGRPEAVASVEATPPSVASGRAACCLASEDTQVPPATPAIQVNGDGHAVVLAAAPSQFILPTSFWQVSDRDLRARSAPRPPLVAVLLI